MKHIKLLTYTLTPLLATQTQPYLNLLLSRTSDWDQFQTLIHSQEYLEKYQDVEKSWNVLVDDVDEWPEYDGYNISLHLFWEFYDNFKIFLEYNLKIFSNFNTNKYTVLEVYDAKLERFYSEHRKNSINKLRGLCVIDMVKMIKILFNNLSHTWKNTQYFYTDLKNISYEQFV